MRKRRVNQGEECNLLSRKEPIARPITTDNAISIPREAYFPISPYMLGFFPRLFKDHPAIPGKGRGLPPTNSHFLAYITARVNKKWASSVISRQRSFSVLPQGSFSGNVPCRIPRLPPHLQASPPQPLFLPHLPPLVPDRLHGQLT